MVLEAGAHIGHGAVVHGARIGANALVGMNAVIMDEAEIGAGSVVGALTFVPAKMVVPPRTVVVGNPARVVKEVSDEMLAWKTEGTALYQRLPAAIRAGWQPTEPLREVPADRPAQPAILRAWHDAKPTPPSAPQGDAR
jgi:hypothetical protein